MEKKEVLQAIEKKRIELGMSKAELARRAGITTRTLNYWECGTRGMTLNNVSMLLNAVGLELVIQECSNPEGHASDR
jgi:transcriptional regulator with XRE-family HTH domain